MIQHISNTNEFVLFVLEQMAGAGQVRSRRMFGGYGIYLDEHFVAIIVDDKLYLKANEGTRQEFESRNLERLVFKMRDKQVEAMYFEAPAEVFDDPDEMDYWARLARNAAVQSGQRKKPSRRAKGK